MCSLEWSKWKEKYEWIVEELGIDPERDRQAAKVLNDLVNESDLAGLESLIQGEECIVFGAGPSLKKDLKKLSRAGWLKKTLISADGATSCVKNFRSPDVIVTDLDGKISDQLNAWREGAWMVVHGHGDNIEEIERVVPKLSNRLIGTIQVEKPAQLHNFGGFTDGDRAAFLANELGASKIILAGMDLGRRIGKYTGDTNEEVKLTKLKICKTLLTWLVEEFDANIINVTSEGEDIPGIPMEDVDDNQHVK